MTAIADSLAERYYTVKIERLEEEVRALREQASWDSLRIADKDCLIERLEREKTELIKTISELESDRLNSHDRWERGGT